MGVPLVSLHRTKAGGGGDSQQMTRPSMSYPCCQLDRHNASSSSQAPAYSFLERRRSKFILELSLQVVLVLVLYSLLQLVLSGVQNVAFYEIGLFLIAFTVAWQTLALSRTLALNSLFELDEHSPAL